MNNQTTFSDNLRHFPALAATLALHLALVLLWQHLRRHEDVSVAEPSWVDWLNVTLPKQATPPVAAPLSPTPNTERRALQRQTTEATPPPARQATAPGSQALEAPVAANENPAHEAPALPSAGDMLQRARKDLAGITKDLKKEFPGARITAPLNTAQARLEKGIEEAAELAPPKWYEAAKIKEIKDAGGYSRRRYRVITSDGTHCVTYESNHAPDGIDTMQKGIKPKVTSCPINFDGTHDQW